MPRPVKPPLSNFAGTLCALFLLAAPVVLAACALAIVRALIRILL